MANESVHSIDEDRSKCIPPLSSPFHSTHPAVYHPAAALFTRRAGCSLGFGGPQSLGALRGLCLPALRPPSSASYLSVCFFVLTRCLPGCGSVPCFVVLTARPCSPLHRLGLAMHLSSSSHLV